MRRHSTDQLRVTWIDTARGVGIILVVYGHALRGLYWPSMPPWATLQDTIIYAFHMPMFFVAAGLFLWPSLERSRAGFLKNKAVTILYPYFLWSLIAGGIELLVAPYVNTPILPADLLKIPVAPIEQFWFLYALFIVHVMLLVVYPHRRLIYLLAVALPLAAEFVALPGILFQATSSFPYVAGGVASAAVLSRLSRSHSSTKIVVLLCSWAAFAIVMTGVIGQEFAGLLPRYCAGFLGTLGTFAGSMLLADVHGARWLARLGRASMAIYVLHTIVSAGTRIMMYATDLPIAQSWVLLASTASGIVVPYLAFVLAERWGLGTALGLGATTRRQHSSAAPLVRA